MRRVAIAVLLAIGYVSSASAQSTGQPKFAVGDRWKTTVAEYHVVKVTETGVSMARPASPCPTCTFVHDKDLTLVQVLDADGKPEANLARFGFLGIGFKLYDFPLEVKKTWKIEGYGLFRGNNVPYVVDSTVSAFEDVKTKAGTFKAYRIDRAWTIRVSQGDSPSWRDTVWYSPDVKVTIKGESAARNQRDWEMESFKLAE